VNRLTPEQIAAQGGNKSFIHIDWMIARIRSTSTAFTPMAGAFLFSARRVGLTVSRHSSVMSMVLVSSYLRK